MLGYIRVNKPEMKVKEYELYRGLYCSLCRAMGKYFGVLSRLTLSYDITFLVLMRLSFSSAVPDFKGGRCPFNPAKKCNYYQNEEKEFRYAAAISMMMFYQKVKDNIRDSSFFKRMLMYIILPYAHLKNKKAKKMFPEIEGVIAQSMIKQAQTEKENVSVTDNAAHESAHALGSIMAYNLENNKDLIYRFGYGIGKWVYLTDAADDMAKDLKKGSFNVYINQYNIKKEDDITEEIKEQIKGELNMSCALSCEAFHDIQNKTLIPVCENIIYEGMEIVMNTILKGKEEK
ncbi:MAG: hypothetical protein IJ491_06140 [Clostridia bacterium]|nr:hypothetical protein [Clostridia bacterium]